MKLRIAFLCAGGALALAGCLAKGLSDAGAGVTTTRQAPRGCARLGEVVGSSGSALRGDLSSPHDLDLGARNDLRNRAAALGADTVQMVRREGVTPQTFAGQSAPTQVRYTGIAWRCAGR
jgi:hypothetical protein